MNRYSRVMKDKIRDWKRRSKFENKMAKCKH